MEAAEPGVAEQALEEVVPELPEWLAEEALVDSVTLEWTPPSVQLDLNQASLGELERLPGVGFIIAQRIVDYREHTGRFNQVEDLLQVPGFDQSMLEEVQARLYVEPQEEPELETIPEPDRAAIVFSEVDAQAGLVEARRSLNQGEMPAAIQHYTHLIRSNQSLPEVIEDLSTALEHYPQEVSVWQCLGDAYLRSNHIKEALAAYIKAEQLLR
jgi:competence ComEA-like helix-hairpin-helix protein